MLKDLDPEDDPKRARRLNNQRTTPPRNSHPAISKENNELWRQPPPTQQTLELVRGPVSYQMAHRRGRLCRSRPAWRRRWSMFAGFALHPQDKTARRES